MFLKLILARITNGIEVNKVSNPASDINKRNRIPILTAIIPNAKVVFW